MEETTELRVVARNATVHPGLGGPEAAMLRVCVKYDTHITVRAKTYAKAVELPFEIWMPVEYTICKLMSINYDKHVHTKPYGGNGGTRDVAKHLLFLKLVHGKDPGVLTGPGLVEAVSDHAAIARQQIKEAVESAMDENDLTTRLRVLGARTLERLNKKPPPGMSFQKHVFTHVDGKYVITWVIDHLWKRGDFDKGRMLYPVFSNYASRPFKSAYKDDIAKRPYPKRGAARNDRSSPVLPDLNQPATSPEIIDLVATPPSASPVQRSLPNEIWAGLSDEEKNELLPVLLR